MTVGPASSSRELASWTPLWLASAVHTLTALEEHWDDDDPVGSIGARDGLTMVLVDALRNVTRGARAVVGERHPAVVAFDERQPDLKELRDRLEHFDEYVRGVGRKQDKTAAAPPTPMEFASSSGGAAGVHTVRTVVEEKSGSKTYVLRTADAVGAAKTLVLTMLGSLGLDDERHQARCSLCRPEIRTP